MASTDLFSLQASDYAKFRPTYPDELFSFVTKHCPAHQLAWDCATGSGQAAVSLVKYFDRIVATDISEALLKLAQTSDKILYRVASAEQSGLEDQSVDLVTVAQALHWFDLEKFYAEVNRVLKPGGIIAAWGYGKLLTEPAIEQFTDAFQFQLLKDYWAPQINILEQRYESIPFPFERIEAPKFEMRIALTFEQLIGYLVSFSATQRYSKEKGEGELQQLFNQIKQNWGDLTQLKPVRWEVFMKVGRAGNSK